MSQLKQVLSSIILIQGKTIEKLNNLQISTNLDLPSSVTQMGNQFNGINQLVKTNFDGKIANSLLSQQILNLSGRISSLEDIAEQLENI